MKRLILLVFLLSLPLTAVGQQSGPAPSSDPLFSWTDRPSITTRSSSLANPQSRETRPRKSVNNPEATRKGDADIEIGIEGYLWTGLALKL